MRGIEPEAAQLFNEAASAYRRRRYKRSAEAYQAAILRCEHPPPNAYLDLAKPLEMLGEWGGALDALRKARRLMPNNPTALRRYERVSQEKAAFESLARSLDRPAPPDAPNYNVSAEAGVSPELAPTARHALRLAWGDFAAAFGYSVQGALHVQLALASSRADVPIWAAGLTRGNRVSLFLNRPDPDIGLTAALLRHEFVHAALNEASPGRCPPWLEEALAEAFAKPMMAWERKLLAADAAQGRLRPFEALPLPLMTLPRGQAKTAYRQCAALGDMLLRGGDAGIPKRILEGLRQGDEANRIIHTALNRSLSELLEEIVKENSNAL